MSTLLKIANDICSGVLTPVLQANHNRFTGSFSVTVVPYNSAINMPQEIFLAPIF